MSLRSKRLTILPDGYFLLLLKQRARRVDGLALESCHFLLTASFASI